jgi:hypothetical protein
LNAAVYEVRVPCCNPLNLAVPFVPSYLTKIIKGEVPTYGKVPNAGVFAPLRVVVI